MAQRVIHSLSAAQIDRLMELYEAEWWTQGRRRADVVRMLAGSSMIVALEDSATCELLGFARVLSDFVYKALILDVIVASEERGLGLGRTLMEAIFATPSLAEVRHFELYCKPEMTAFYEAWGFSADLGELRLLRREAERPPTADGTESR